MPQVGGDAVRDIHHGVHFRTFAEPDAFGDLRGGVAVDLCQRGVVPSGQDVAQSGARLSQRTADGDQVAGACVAAPFDMAVGDAPDGRYIDDQSRIRGCGVAPDQADVVLGREVAVAFHEIFDPSFGQVVRDSQREQGCDRAGAHRRDIAQIDGQGFTAQFTRRGRPAQEVDVFGQQVGGEDQRFAAAQREDRAVVPDAVESVAGDCGEHVADRVDKSEFSHVEWRFVRSGGVRVN